MTARSQMRKLFGLHLPKTSRASRQRSRKQTHDARMLLEQMEARVMLSAAIVSVPNGPTGAATPTAWLGALPDSISLTDISTPGTYKSASGPSLQDALLGSGSSNEVAPPNPTTMEVTDAVLAAHEAAAVAAEVAILAGGSNQAANVTATTAIAAASAVDTAAGITQTSTGAGLGIGLASDAAWLTSAIATNVQTGLSSTDGTADAAADTADAAVTAPDTAAATAATAAATADAAAGTADAVAGTADAAAGTADTAAGAADTAAGTADAAALAADTVAAVADGVAVAQGGIDPVADGVAAGLDGTAAGLDTAAVAANTAADVANGAAIAADGTAATADTAAEAANTAAEAANGTFSGTTAAAEAADTAAGTANATAAAAHTAAATSDAFSAASFVAGAASDGMTAQQYASFAAGISSPDTTGNNPNNAAYQNAVKGLAVTAATAHSASAAAETAAAVADTAATVANATAVSANTAAVSAVAAADVANAAAATADETATAADTAATTADAAAEGLDAAAATADAAAEAADVAAEAADAAAGIDDGVTAGAEGAAAVADTTAIALDITAAATAWIPFVDIGTAAAAGIADVVAAGLDVASDVAAGTDIIADGVAAGLDATAVAADAAAATADAAAVAADATAVTADATAVTADAAAATADTAAATADAAAVTACETATAANDAADAADKTASIANQAATVASATAIAADIAFLAEVRTVQGTQTSLQTQTMSIADQLSAGIRSLDLRGALVNDTINLNAGQNFTGVTLQDGLNDMTSFLQANPSETIVVKLSANEAAPISSPNGFNADLNKLLNSSDTAVPGTAYKDFIYSSSNPTTTPNLGQVRGKIVIIPDQSWTPAPDQTGQTIGWQPTKEVVHDSTTVSDPAQLWNLAENDGNNAGLIPTDLGNPSTLYRTNLSQDSTTSASPVAMGDSVNAFAEQYFASGSGTVTRTTGIVGMDDPDQNLINEIINENNLPIVVTSDSDTPGDTGTLRAAINQANLQLGVSSIEFGSTGNTISLQSDLPTITNDLVIAGTVLINTNGHQGLQAALTHDVTETDYVASDSGSVTKTPSTDTHPVYLDTSGLTEVGPGTVAVDPVHITYGTALDNSQLNGIVTDTTGASIPGTFAYAGTEAGTVLKAGNGQSEAVTFTPSNTSLPQESGTVIVNVAKATPTITNVSSPVNIGFGTALDNTQLSGTATVDGTFVYTSAAGTVLHAGNGQSESITFIPTDTTDYTSVSSTVTVNVAQATPTVTVDPVNIGFGTALDNTQLSGTATFTVGGNSVNVPGTFTYTSTSAAGTVLNGGDGQREAVTFTPADTTDYKTVSLNVIVNVSSHATPTVAIIPVNITYGTALANSQLSGTAIFTLRGKPVTVVGTFTYTSAANTVLNAGNGQSERFTFTPNDTTTYTTVSSNVFVNVAQATPAISNVNLVKITYGTALDNGQLSGTATFTVDGNSVPVPGTFTYTSAEVGTVLKAGNNQSEAVTFTPTDTTDYTPASGTVTVNVAQATPTVAINPVTIIYGTALANSQLSGTATFTVDGKSVPVLGTFTYTSAEVGSLLKIGNNQSEAVTFTPKDDTTDYTTVPLNVTVNVLPIPPTVTVPDASGIYNGLAFPVTGTATGVNGVNIATQTNPTFYYYLKSDYDSNVPDLRLISWGDGSGVPTSGKNLVIVGTDNNSLLHIRIFDANGVRTDTFETKDSSGALHLETADASGTVLSDKLESSLPPTQANAITTLKQQLPGLLLPPHVLTVAEKAQVTGEATSIVGQTHLNNPDAAQPLTGAPSDAGKYVAVAVFTKTGNYGDGGAITSFSIDPAATATTITSSANPAVYGQPITYTATVTNTSGTTPAPVPDGSVQFVVDGGVNSGGQTVTVRLNALGQAVLPDTFLSVASHSVQADYLPSTNSVGNKNFVTSNKPISLTQGVQSILVEPDPSNPALKDLFIGSSGATSNDQVQVSPVGSSTDVKVQTRLNGVNTQSTYSPNAINAIYVFLQNGNDNVTMASTLTINTNVTAGDGNETVQLGGGSNTVTLGGGNDNVTAGNGNNTVTLGNGNDTIQLGNGSNVVVEGGGNDSVTAGNGNNLIVGGMGHDTIKVGNGTNILIAGSATVTVNVNMPNDSFRQILNAWTEHPIASNQIAIRQRFTVNSYNMLNQTTLTAGSGIDWFFYQNPPTTSNKKRTDFWTSPPPVMM